MSSPHRPTGNDPRAEPASSATRESRRGKSAVPTNLALEDASRLLFESVVDYAIFLLDADGRVATWNPGSERIKGYRAEEIVGEHCSRFYAPEDVAAGRPALELERAASEGSFSEEGWRVRKDGSRFWADILLTAMRGERGELRGFAKITRDITERRQAEQAVSDAGAQMLAITNAVIDGIIVIDERGTIESLNPAALRMFGYDAGADVIGRNIRMLMPEPYHSEHDRYLANYRETGERKIIGIGREVTGKRADGSVFPLDLSVTEVNLGDRRIFTGIVRDLTERKRAEVAAIDAGAQMLAITNAVIDGIVVIDERGTIESLNPAALRIFGYDAAGELVGRNIRMLMPEPYHSEHDRYLANYLSTGERKIIGIGREVTGRRADGSEFPMDLSVTEVHLGERRVFTGLVRDITERKRAEQELERRAAELERSNADLEQFASVASHDLQEPLRMVTAYVDLLERRHAEQLDPEGREFLSVVIEGATRMQSLIRDLLNYSRVGASAEPLEQIDLRGVVEQAVEILAQTVREGGAEVAIGELPTVTGRRNLLVQLFQNLIGNAIKFRSQDTPRIEVGASQGHEGWMLHVQDNGIGIEPQFSERVFEIFQRLHTKSAYPGTGIGLAICKKIVERHGGRIWVEATPGGGSRFQFTLPGSRRS